MDEQTAVIYSVVSTAFMLFVILGGMGWLWDKTAGFIAAHSNPEPEEPSLDALFMPEQYPVVWERPNRSRKTQRRIVNWSGYVYLLKAHDGYWKIGHTNNPDNRLRTFSVKLPFPVEYEHLIPCDNRLWAEQTLHTRYAAQRIKGEWFELSPEQVEEIKAITKM